MFDPQLFNMIACIKGLLPDVSVRFRTETYILPPEAYTRTHYRSENTVEFSGRGHVLLKEIESKWHAKGVICGPTKEHVVEWSVDSLEDALARVLAEILLLSNSDKTPE
jgi:hypothetical protein